MNILIYLLFLILFCLIFYIFFLIRKIDMEIEYMERNIKRLGLKNNNIISSINRLIKRKVE